MSIFARCSLTRLGRNLIAKTETSKTHISFTGAAVGDGVWNADEDLEEATELKHAVREYAISDIAVTASNEANVQITVVIHNREQEALFYVMEMGIYATDPDLGEILYAILTADNKYIYLPAENGIGISLITERINLEVYNASTVTVETAGALVSATDFLALRQIVEAATANLQGGSKGQILIKQSEDDYEYLWVDTNIMARPYAEFPETGQSDALYIDSDSSEFYIWKTLSDGSDGYFKLPVGSEASSTLQKQITENAGNITGLQKSAKALASRFSEVTVIALAESWSVGEEDGISVYTQEIAVDGMTEDTDGTVYPYIHNTAASSVVEELKAVAVFFGRGISESGDGKLILKCYKKCPEADFGLTFQGALGEG